MVTPNAKIYGKYNSAEAYQLRDFLTRSGVVVEWSELNSDEEAKRLGASGLSDARLPICVLSQGSVLFRPTTRDLAAALDWFREPKHQDYDVAICGAGPAGLSAAVYAASEGLRTIVVERSAVGGQAASTSRIENYLGFPDGISGWELSTKARQQAQRFGAEIIVTAEGIGLGFDNGSLVGHLAGGGKIVTRAAICATGVEYAKLGLPNEERFLNHGFFYGAGPSEAVLSEGHVFIVGGGNSAGQAALHFAAYAERVTLLVRGQHLEDTLSTYLLERIEHSERIEVRTQSVLTSLEGGDSLTGITYKSCLTGEETCAKAQGVFVCIGGRPRTDWITPGPLYTDSAGYILTGDDLEGMEPPIGFWLDGRRPMLRESSMPGLFAAGDVRHNSIKRVATAVGEGATAVSMVHQYLSLKRRPIDYQNL
ncbi:NAD(P)/FAD-dependent oxidoreductase [Granulicella mallensis]|uniref:Thioredoxin reductase (NADPH) n=1 Tax=Granulicella mallensis TaxID=940614 RepID=A0A7W7ZV53_9BACT|nr:FAD-dependent oxidoreductase [Granulicella mallensis]MBB5066757.1 thioredoxin reductase (NADPH) [Granulicella mallensis]